MTKYLHPSVPIHPDEIERYGGDVHTTCHRMIEKTIERMYADSDENRFLEVTYASGDKEILYFKDFNSGAMIENIVRRAKKDAIKRFLSNGREGHQGRGPVPRDPRRVQGERGPPEHDEPRRLGPDLRQEGRAHRLRAHAARSRRRRAAGRAGQRRAVPVAPGYSALMAIPKVMGTETEYGIAASGQPDFNPVLSSSMLISAYAGSLRKIRWDYEDESPMRDARGFEPQPGREMSDEDLGLANVILPNGARYYVDHAHPEYSTPECLTPRDLVIHDKAGERILERSLEVLAAEMPQTPALSIYKNNSDGKGNSYGTHENYLVDRATPFADIVRDLTPFFVTRQVFTGAGKVGFEGSWDDRDHGRVPAHRAGRLLRDRGRPRDDAEAPDHQHARRAARRPREVPPAARDRRRREPVRGGAVPEDGHDGDRAEDDRGRLPARLLARRAGGGDPRGLARPRPRRRDRAHRRPADDGRPAPERVPGARPQVCRPRGRHARQPRGDRSAGSR